MQCVPLRSPTGTTGFICGRGIRTRLICDVCDAPVKASAPKFLWQGREVDVCPNCRARYRDEPEFRAFADNSIATHYP